MEADERQKYKLLDEKTGKSIKASEKEIDLINTVMVYRNQRVEFMEDSHDSESLTSATEELQQGFFRQQKRLRKRNLQIELQEEDVKIFPFMGRSGLAQMGGFFCDGEYILGCFLKKLKCTTKYRRNHREAVSFQDIPWVHYYTREEPGEVGKVSSVDVFYQQTAYDRRSEYWNNKRFVRKKIGLVFQFILLVLVWLVSGIIGIFVWASLFVQLNLDRTVLGLLLCWACLKGSVELTKIVQRNWNGYRLRKQSHSVVKSIREKEPDFVIEKFIAMVDNKMNSIYYADSQEELGAIIACDLSAFLKEHENVVNREQINFWFESFRQDETYQYIEVIQRATVTRDLEEKIIREQQDVKLRFMKPIDSIMSEDFYQDWYVVAVEVLK